jgi:cytochrome P450
VADESVVCVMSFLHDVAVAEQQAPLPPPPPPLPDPDDPRYVGDPARYEQDRQTAVSATAAFEAAAKARGGAVAQVISRWLATAPYAMLQELADQPAAQLPIFKPLVGPAVVMRQEHVLRCLERCDLFTVDPYAAGMARATDDRTRNPAAYAHFLLGTDRDELYELDDLILRRAVTRHDEEAVSAIARKEAERWTRTAAGSGEIDVAATVAKFVPLRIVGDYLGVPYHDEGEASWLPGLGGGDEFPLDDELAAVYTFTRIAKGRVPTADDLYGWIKDAFRNIFNNFNPAAPLFADFRERGIVATEYLTAYVHALVEALQERMRRGEAVPDTMLTRLLRMQAEVSEGGDALERELSSLLGRPLPDGELSRRLSDSMIRSNVVGTIVGAVVNPQEATARITDSMLRLKDGEYPTVDGASHAEAARLAGIEDDEPGYAEGVERLRRYALEALRLQPQGEVLLRLCVQDNAELGGVTIRKGTPVFVAFAAAMRDPEAVRDPLSFDVGRDENLTPYQAGGVRAREAPQSRTYLQHGYGRHKCLGRYASEVTMRESLRALLRLGRWERRSALELDEQGLYVEHLRVGISADVDAERRTG